VILDHLKTSGLNRAAEGSWARVIVEKPFGKDLKTAHALNGLVSEVFEERDTYRIDHYLGKETAQNIMVMRFANSIFESVWDSSHVAHVQITAAEPLGVEGRAGYYDTSGAMRDMVQNHLLQLLTLTAMEPPTSLGADAVRDEKVKVLRSLRPCGATTSSATWCARNTPRVLSTASPCPATARPTACPRTPSPRPTSPFR